MAVGQTCINCDNFRQNADGRLECLAGRKDFRKQLLSGEVLQCSGWKRSQ